MNEPTMEIYTLSRALMVMDIIDVWMSTIYRRGLRPWTQHEMREHVFFHPIRCISAVKLSRLGIVFSAILSNDTDADKLDSVAVLYELAVHPITHVSSLSSCPVFCVPARAPSLFARRLKAASPGQCGPVRPWRGLCPSWGTSVSLSRRWSHWLCALPLCRCP